MAPTPTSATGMTLARNKEGFTLIELMVVVTVLALLAAAITPSLVSMKKTSDHRDAISALRRLPSEARNEAVRRGQIVTLTYADNDKSFKLETTNTDGEQEEIKTLAVTPDLEPSTFRDNSGDVNSSDFQLTFSPDGHSNGGALGFATTYLTVDTDGAARFVSGEIPAAQDQKWEAGSLEQRS